MNISIMKKTTLFLFICLAIVTNSINAQTEQAYTFTIIKENPITSIKNQGNSGTCWAFSGVGFLESELLRMGKGEYDLSDMYIVRKNYADKAQKYVRLGGSLNYAQGGSFADVVETIDEYGVLPNQDYEGLNYGETSHNHSELEAALGAYVRAISENRNKRISTAWITGLNGILDAYFGEIPSEFTYQGKKYTPQSFAQSLGLNSENYISLTSFTHHPFYEPFAVEVPDNWRWAMSYNLPLNELTEVVDNAIKNGYTVAWATDVSEVGFSRSGIAVVPDEEAEENIGSDQAHWLGLSQSAKSTILKSKIDEGPVKEKSITQEMRQTAFDNQETTDDHGMQIFGIAQDQNGSKYYMVKNSWGKAGNYEGIWYVSEPFFQYKTTSLIIHKDALPKEIAKKMHLK